MEKGLLQMGIIGGGIGGLATTYALQRQGIGVTVFERNPELREIGAGLTLWANGVQVLRQLGLADALAAVSVPLTHFECWFWRGKRLGGMPLDPIEWRVGTKSIGIHRAIAATPVGVALLSSRRRTYPSAPARRRPVPVPPPRASQHQKHLPKLHQQAQTVFQGIRHNWPCLGRVSRLTDIVST